MRLFLVITGQGDNNYILASCPADAKRYFKDVHIMDCRELEVTVSVAAINYWKQ